VELSDGHNELFRSVVQGLLLRRTLRPRGGLVRFELVPQPPSAASPTPRSAGPRSDREYSPSCGLAVVVAAFVKPADASPLGRDEAVQGFLRTGDILALDWISQ